MFITHVKAHCKGQTFDTAIGRFTLIVGRNRGGKTALVNAIELGCWQAASEVRGREWVASAGLLRALADHKTGALFSDLTWSDGRNTAFPVKRGEARKMTMGFYELRETMLGKPDKAYSGIFEAAAGLVTPAMIRAALGSAADQLPAASLTSIRDFRIEAKQRAQLASQLHLRLEGARALVARREVPQDPKQMMRRTGGLVGKATFLNAFWRSLLRDAYKQGGRAFYVKLGEAAQVLRAEIEDDAPTADQVAEAQERAATQERLLGRHRRLQAIALLAHHHHTTGAATCQLCQRAEADPARWAKIAAQADRHDQQTDPATPESVRAAKQQAASLEARAKRSGSADSEAPRGVDDIRRFLRDVDFEITEYNLNEARMEQQRAREAMEPQIALMTEEADGAKALAEVLAQASATLADQVLVELRRRANRCLLEGEEIVLEFRNSEVVYGFRRGDVVDVALSGTEEIRYFLALMSAMAEGGAPVVAIAPDRGWDPAELSATLAAFQESPHQIILQSTVMPKGRVPKGWVVVRLDAEEQETGKEAKEAKEAKPRAAKAPKPPVKSLDELAFEPMTDGPPVPSWVAALAGKPWEATTTINDYLATQPDAFVLDAATAYASPRWNSQVGVWTLVARAGIVAFSPSNERQQRRIYKVEP